MTDEEALLHAQRIADEMLESAEFCWVYEDEELEDASEEDQVKVFEALTSLVSIHPDEVED